MILSCFLLFEEDSNCFLLFVVFSVAFNFIWLFEYVSNFLKVVLGCCASGLGCLRCQGSSSSIVLGFFGLFKLQTSLLFLWKFLYA